MKYKKGETVYHREYGKGVITWVGKYVLYQVRFDENMNGKRLLVEERKLFENPLSPPLIIISDVDPYGEEDWNE